MLLPTSRKPAPVVRSPRFRVPGSRFASATAATLVVVACASFLSGAQAQTAGFADPAFEALWLRSDGLVASGEVSRPWVWGPAPGEAMQEPFLGLPGDTHLVQFFDKGRMEINDPAVDPSDPFYVTNGRLAIELISGQVQTGLSTFQDIGTAQINLASDADDPSAPTYGSFNGVASIPGAPNDRTAPDQTGTIVRTAIDRQGNTQPWPDNHLDYGVTLAHYEEATGHNIPDIFWNYLNQQATIVQDGQVVEGPLFYPWFAVTGYPISEPYWSYVKVEGKYTDVLIQAYERRVLTFVPHLPSPFKVQMGNIGQHYFEWRYDNGSTNPPPVVPTPTQSGLPPTANLTIDGIEYRQAVFDINGTFCIITNRGDNAVSLAGWRLDSPKWTFIDTFYFPGNVTIAPGASINVRSGAGQNTGTDVYMNRPTVMWDGMNYDYAVLYDNYARQVTDFFPAGDVGPPPTAPPVVTGTPDPNLKPTDTPVPGAPTNTPQGPPPPVGTGTVPVATDTPKSGDSTPSPTPTGGTPTAGTPTASATPGGSCAELVVNGDFEDLEQGWTAEGYNLVGNSLPHSGTYGAYLGDLPEVNDKLWQNINIPGSAGRVSLSYWVHMISEDTGGVHDNLFTQILSQDGGTLRVTLDTVTNLSTAGVWQQKTFDITAFRGETIRLQYNATTDISGSTDFFFDDITMQACP